MHLIDRLHKAKQRLAPVQSKYRVIFEDPADPEACACVLVPDPNWMAAALAGGILPPIDTYLRDRSIEEAFVPQYPGHTFSWNENGGASHPYAEPIGPMAEEEAIEYLIKKDIPPRIWRDYRGNRVIMKIVPVELIPSDRTFRGAWKVAQETQLNEEAA